MRQYFGVNLAYFLGAVLFGCAASQSAEPTSVAFSGFTEQVAPFFKKYCLDCHNDSEASGDLVLKNVTAETLKDQHTWVRVFERLSDGSMPPAKEMQPSNEERQSVVGWVDRTLKTQLQEEQSLHGRSRIRRLNRLEIANTLHDLLGAKFDIEGLPEDGIAAGFDNVDAALDVSAPFLEKYLEIVDEALRQAIDCGTKPVQSTKRIDYVKLGKQQTKTNVPMPRFGISTRIRSSDVVFFSHAMASKPVIDALTNESGLYRFRIMAHAMHVNESMTLLVYTGNYGRGVQGLMTRPVAMVDVPQERSVIEFTVPLLKGETISLSPRGMPNIYTEVASDYQGPGLAVEWLKVEGPIIDTWPPAPTVSLLGDLDLAQATPSQAREVIVRFAPRAFRRPVDEAELLPYFQLLQTQLDQASTLPNALRVALKGILLSPDFLYLHGTPGTLNEYDLASRLSYFLWSGMPDAELNELASRRELHKPETLKATVERMLKDPRASAFTQNFVGQWLSLRNLKATIPDKKLYPDFDEWLEFSMPRETYAFFDRILDEDRSVSEFLHSDWSILNEPLARLYKIPDIHGSNFRRVALPPDSHRGGVLTQAAVLKVTANGTNTSPVVRGAWVLDHLLGRPAPPPPKNVPAIEPDIRGATTLREQLEKHRQIESCAACHQSIDPYGNALENFDVIGGWREFYRMTPGNGRRTVKLASHNGSVKNVAIGATVDPSDKLVDDRAFANIDELKQLMLADIDSFASSLASKLLVYATGHRMEFSDTALVEVIVQGTKTSDYGLRSLIHEIVQSPLFQRK